VAEGWVALGDRAVRLPRPAGVSPRALVAALRAWPGVIDVVVARHDIAAYFDRPPVIDPAWLAALAAAPPDAAPVRDHELVAVYDGDDLDDVARAAGLSVAEVIALHAGTTYAVDTIGFAPGFAYLAGVDPRLALPRRATPRPRVPAGSLAIAGGYTAVYPFASAGGWHLLGRVTSGPMFGPTGARLALGDRVRFVPR
jgi:5-oxoprolinase (ATP-hydrolysing) subunit A